MPARILFADTFYWIELLDPRDAFHAAVLALAGTLGTVRLATSDEVLAEVLTFFSPGGPLWRSKAAAMIHSIRSNPDIDVLPQTRATMSDPWFQSQFAERIGGTGYGKGSKIYKFEKIKRAKRAALAAHS